MILSNLYFIGVLKETLLQWRATPACIVSTRFLMKFQYNNYRAFEISRFCTGMHSNTNSLQESHFNIIHCENTKEKFNLIIVDIQNVYYMKHNYGAL